MEARNVINTPAGPVGAGDTIEYRAFGGATRRVLVETVDHDIKNGRAGFDGMLIASNGSGDRYGDTTGLGGGAAIWGYADQITRILARA